MIKPYEQYESDVDYDIDTSDVTETYDISKSWGCQYWVKDYGGMFCLEETVVNDQFCKRHSRFVGKIPFKIKWHDDPMYEVSPVIYRHHSLTGHFWYPQMLLAAKPTSEGMIVIGRLLGQRWIKSLTRREIKRCHNSGLLYKVLPQEIVHKNYDIPNIDSIEGVGFTSFDQIRLQRPTLYIKYWNIWNSHIQRRKEFIKKHDGYRDRPNWIKEHNCPLPDWEELKEINDERGYNNVIIPAPSLDQVRDISFDPWIYCEDWVKRNQPRFLDKPHFPPMYIDYPDPYSMRFRPYKQTTLREIEVDKHTPRRTKHYNYPAEWWLNRITNEGKEWMQIYF